MNIYQINENIRAILEGVSASCYNADGEYDEELALKALSELQAERTIKIENTALFVKELEAESIALKVEEDAMAARRKRKDKLRERLKELVLNEVIACGRRKFETTRVEVKISERKALDYNENVIPGEWYRERTERALDKTLIRQAVKEGEIIPGVTQTVSRSISIK